MNECSYFKQKVKYLNFEMENGGAAPVLSAGRAKLSAKNCQYVVK